MRMNESIRPISPLRYPGGKSKNLKNIKNLFPQRCKEYREPFLGGGSVAIEAMRRFYTVAERFWLNDLYPDLFLFWKQLKISPHVEMETIKRIACTYGDIQSIGDTINNPDNGRMLYHYILDNRETFSEMERAAAFFIMNRITYGGLTYSGGYSQAAYTERFNDQSLAHILAVNDLMSANEKAGSAVHITNLDYTAVVNEPGDDVFIYLDPPYSNVDRLYGTNGDMHNHFDHESFAGTMRSCTHQWLITYDDSPFIRELFSFAHIIEWKPKYSATKSSGAELFITNMDAVMKRPRQSQMQLSGGLLE